jgi:hypothetical protein
VTVITVKRYEGHGIPRVTADLDSWYEGELVAVELVSAGDSWEGYPTYDLLVDGERIGSVRRTTITVERSSAGNRYVNSRHESKPRYWAIDVPGHRDYGLTYDTRKAAVASAVEAHDSKVRQAPQA